MFTLALVPLKFDVPGKVIAKKTRWHRIAMILELSSEQATASMRGSKNAIRSVQSLTATDEGASGSELNVDLDSFAGDLENLLDAEEFEGDGAVNEPKHDRSEGVKGLKMRRYPSQTEAVEAAELCKMLMGDEQKGFTKKRKFGPAQKEGGPVTPLLGYGSENMEHVKKSKNIVKAIISSTQPEEAFNAMENILETRKIWKLCLARMISIQK